MLCRKTEVDLDFSNFCLDSEEDYDESTLSYFLSVSDSAQSRKELPNLKVKAAKEQCRRVFPAKFGTQH